MPDTMAHCSKELEAVVIIKQQAALYAKGNLGVGGARQRQTLQVSPARTRICSGPPTSAASTRASPNETISRRLVVEAYGLEAGQRLDHEAGHLAQKLPKNSEKLAPFARERVFCLLVLDSVISIPQWIRQPKPRDKGACLALNPRAGRTPIRNLRGCHAG